jgi:putative transposase
MRTIKQTLKLNKSDFQKLKDYSVNANCLYNCALYTVKEHYNETNTYIGYNALDKMMQLNKHYKAIPSFNAQQIIRLVDQNYRSYFSLLRKKLQGQYASEVRTPKFRKRGYKFNLIFDNTRIYVKNNTLKLYKNLKLKFSYDVKNIKQGIIKWKGNKFVLYLTYEQQNEPLKSDNGNYLSIDLGLNNFASCFSNVGHSFIVNGKPLKAYNQFYNKRIAKIKSELKTKNNKHWSKKLDILTHKRERWIDNYLNQAVAFIVKEALSLEINTIVCGYNETWKQEINLGKKTNQNFVQIPYYKFKQKLQSRCEKEGLRFILREESYTSKCSFLDNEEICKHEEYKGSRIKRGLFKTSSGILCNADINGAANILKKEFPNTEYVDGIEAFIVKPKVLNLFNL